MIKFHSPTPNRCRCKSENVENCTLILFQFSPKEKKKPARGTRQKHEKFQLSQTTEKRNGGKTEVKTKLHKQTA